MSHLPCSLTSPQGLHSSASAPAVGLQGPSYAEEERRAAAAAARPVPRRQLSHYMLGGNQDPAAVIIDKDGDPGHIFKLAASDRLLSRHDSSSATVTVKATVRNDGSRGSLCGVASAERGTTFGAKSRSEAEITRGADYERSPGPSLLSSSRHPVTSDNSRHGVYSDPSAHDKQSIGSGHRTDPRQNSSTRGLSEHDSLQLGGSHASMPAQLPIHSSASSSSYGRSQTCRDGDCTAGIAQGGLLEMPGISSNSSARDSHSETSKIVWDEPADLSASMYTPAGKSAAQARRFWDEERDQSASTCTPTAEAAAPARHAKPDVNALLSQIHQSLRKPSHTLQNPRPDLTSDSGHGLSKCGAGAGLDCLQSVCCVAINYIIAPVNLFVVCSHLLVCCNSNRH